MVSANQADRVALRREEILEEATRLFAAEGYARAKVDDVAARLRIAKGTVYRYFPTKEQLFLAAADRAMEGLQNAILSVTDPIDDPFEKLKTGVKAYLSFFDANLHLIEIFVHERAEFRDRKKPSFLTYSDKNITKFETLLAEMKKAGLVRDIDEKLAAETVANTLYGTVHMHFLRGSRKRLSRLAPQMIDIIFRGILTPAGTRANKASAARKAERK
ncbi:MAG: TetR/AcrR family transcriptional regulator [Planctomycetes bacterium]|nr:TetR/AcrR family transcriptional regulator [Planctomycetota bacterium]